MKIFIAILGFIVILVFIFIVSYVKTVHSKMNVMLIKATAISLLSATSARADSRITQWTTRYEDRKTTSCRLWVTLPCQ